MTLTAAGAETPPRSHGCFLGIHPVSHKRVSARVEHATLYNQCQSARMDVTARHMLQVDMTTGSDEPKTTATISTQLRAVIAASSNSRLPMASVEQRMCSLELSDDCLCVTCTDGTRGAHVSIVVAWNRCFQLTVAVADDTDHRRSATDVGNGSTISVRLFTSSAHTEHISAPTLRELLTTMRRRVAAS